MDELSKAASVSKYHLSREFKRYMGCSPMQYLIMLRLENAAALLRGTSLPLSAIAETVGIGSEQYLARMFKRHNGITLGQFRKGC
jgi:iron complex transport system substrate-binding protein